MKKFIGVLLIVLGLLGFAVSGVSFTTTEEVADVGPVEVETEEERSIPIGPIASGAVVVGGIVLLVVGFREDKT